MLVRDQSSGKKTASHCQRKDHNMVPLDHLPPSHSPQTFFDCKIKNQGALRKAAVKKKLRNVKDELEVGGFRQFFSGKVVFVKHPGTYILTLF